MQIFTQEDLVQYMYKVTSPAKSAAIKAALESDWSLRESYETLVSAQKQLNTLDFSPRQEAIDKVLQHAHKGITELHQ